MHTLGTNTEPADNYARASFRPISEILGQRSLLIGPAEALPTLRPPNQVSFSNMALTGTTVKARSQGP